MAERSPYQAERRQELAVGLILLAFGVAWTGVVFATIPPGNFGVGPRAFPLWLGVALVVLSGIMVGAAWARRNGAGEAPEPSELAGSGWPLLRTVVAVCLIIGAYGFLMQGAGFVLATAAVVAFTLWFVLGVRRPLLVAGMAAGITSGAWFAFGQILGAYLPPGTWSLF